MQSRRHESMRSPTGGSFRERRVEMDRDRYLMCHSPRYKRSLSPGQVERSRPVVGGGRRSISPERGDRDWDLGRSRGRGDRSRSPPIGQVHKRPHYDDKYLNRDEFRPRYDEAVSSRDDFLPRSKEAVWSRDESRPRYDERISSRDDIPPLSNEAMWSRGHFQPRNEFSEYMNGKVDSRTRLKHDNEYDRGRTSYFSEKDQKVLDGGHGLLNQKSRVFEDASDFGSSSKYADIDRNFSSTVPNLEVSRFRDERIRYPDPLMLDKSYREGEKNMYLSRDVSLSTIPSSLPKDLTGSSRFKDFSSTSISRANFQGSYQDAMDDAAFGGGYGNRRTSDTTGREAEPAQKDQRSYRLDTFSPPRPVRQDYLYPNEYKYPFYESYRKVGKHEQIDQDCRDTLRTLRSSMLEPVDEPIHTTEYPHMNLHDSYSRDDPSPRKRTVANYIGSSSSGATLKHGAYLDLESARIEHAKELLREHEIPHVGVPGNHEISDMRLDYGFSNDAGPLSYKERARGSPEFQYETKMHRRGMGAEEQGAYNPSGSMIKRKYKVDEETIRQNYISKMSGEWNNTSRTEDLDDRGEEWLNLDDNNDLETSCVGDDHWFSRKSHKPGGKYVKGYPRRGNFSWYNTHALNRKHVLPKRNNVWVRGKNDNEANADANDVDESEGWVNSAVSEPAEDSEEFKQLVDKFFLSFTKKINENPGVQKRYKEQGRAGGLFCIVCGRSQSKEFLDTQRLATHAFMCHKAGLRAQHMGLHKAICVLMGWNSEAAADTITWTPETLSSSEALAQKADLVIWPPVVLIHYSSVSDSNTHKTMTTEAIGDFLRGKGFSIGKLKICLGKPGNIVVKFLGTFPGLQEAENLHNYFSENKRGRTDLDKNVSSVKKGKAGIECKDDDVSMMYGYIGIAEDLEKVDFDTKRKCLIKSKKEIQEILNAPLKP